VKRRLGLFSEGSATDASLVLPRAERRTSMRRAIGIISVVDAEALVDAITEAMPGALRVSTPGDASAEEVDRALAEAEERGAPLLVACGEGPAGRLRVDLSIAITGGRPLAKQPPAFRILLPEADLVLTEPRLGLAVELARVLGGEGGGSGP